MGVSQLHPETVDTVLTFAVLSAMTNICRRTKHSPTIVSHVLASWVLINGHDLSYVEFLTVRGGCERGVDAFVLNVEENFPRIRNNLYYAYIYYNVQINKVQ